MKSRFKQKYVGELACIYGMITALDWLKQRRICIGNSKKQDINDLLMEVFIIVCGVENKGTSERTETSQVHFFLKMLHF